jgi:hypothetical protein
MPCKLQGIFCQDIDYFAASILAWIISTFKTLNIFFTVNSCFDSRFYFSIYICFSMDTLEFVTV